MKNDVHDLGLVLDSRIKLTLIESWDEPKVMETLTGLAVRRGLGLYAWSVTEGVQRLGFGGEPPGGEENRDPVTALRLIKHDQQANLYVLCDLHPFLGDSPTLARLLKEIVMAEGNHRPTVVLVSHALKPPAEVQRSAARFSLSLPNEGELLGIVREEATRWSERNRGTRVHTDNRTLQQVVKSLRGLNHAEARLLARNVICNNGATIQEDLLKLNRTKFQLLDLGGVLSFKYDTARLAEVGGFATLKRWLGKRQSAFLAGKSGDQPEGMILVGVQGAGKSLAAKAVAGLWGLPLLRLDFVCLYNKYFGETERSLREALRLAKQMAPCVLWIDEVEKGISGSDQDNGVSQRVLDTLLTWMAEREALVFMVATANAIDHLPPELICKGRFDELFSVDLPTPEVRAEIFRIHLQCRELEPAQFDLLLLVAVSEGFSGVKIEQAVVAALYAEQARQQAVGQELLLRELLRTSPLSVLMAEKLAALRTWTKGRTVPAD